MVGLVLVRKSSWRFLWPLAAWFQALASEAGKSWVGGWGGGSWPISSGNQKRGRGHKLHTHIPFGNTYLVNLTAHFPNPKNETRSFFGFQGLCLIRTHKHERFQVSSRMKSKRYQSQMKQNNYTELSGCSFPIFTTKEIAQQWSTNALIISLGFPPRIFLWS